MQFRFVNTGLAVIDHTPESARRLPAARQSIPPSAAEVPIDSQFVCGRDVLVARGVQHDVWPLRVAFKLPLGSSVTSASSTSHRIHVAAMQMMGNGMLKNGSICVLWRLFMVVSIGNSPKTGLPVMFKKNSLGRT